jgi:hypothetical protein
VRLWQFVRYASETERVPVVLARKISPATFSVLKRLGTVGVQYYSMLVAPAHQPAALGSRSVGWVHTRPAEIEELSPVRNRLREILASASNHAVIAREAIDAALAWHLDSVSGLHSDSLIEWANAVDLSAPPVWFATLGRWKRFDANRGQQPLTPQAVIQAPDASSTGHSLTNFPDEGLRT